MTLAAVLLAGRTEQLLEVLLVLVLAAIACVGIGATALLLRVILPGVAHAADASLGRMRARRLTLFGLLPLLGAGALARGVSLAGTKPLEVAYLVLVALPLALALIAGLMAGLPHVGARVLRADSDPAPLLRATLGGLVVGLAMVSWALPPLGLLVSFLLAAWALGIGIGAVVHAPGGERTADSAVPAP